MYTIMTLFKEIFLKEKKNNIKERAENPRNGACLKSKASEYTSGQNCQ